MFKWLYYTPQCLMILWGVQLYMLYINVDFYRIVYPFLDAVDTVLLFICLTHVLFSVFYAEKRKKFSEYYIACSISIFLISVLNILYLNYQFDIILYYIFYSALLISNYTYYFSEIL